MLTVPVFIIEMGGHFDLLHLASSIATPAQFTSGDAGGAVGRLAVLRARRAIAALRPPQHVHADRAWAPAWPMLYSVVAALAPGTLSRGIPRHARRHRGLFRSRRRHHRARPARPGSGAARARSDRRSAIRALLDLAPKTGAADQGRRQRRGRAARRGDGRRPAARPAGRESAGRRRRPRGQIGDRRIHDHRRSHAGDQGRRRASHRRHAQRQRRLRHARGEDRPRHPAGADRPHGRDGAAHRARRSQRLADQVAGWFVPLVIAVALVAFAAWAMFGPQPRFAYALVAAVSVLIIACPCALGLATPMSIMVGVGRGAQSGILIKNAEALERMEKIDTLVVDKTGTLTEGKPRVVACRPAPGFDEDDAAPLAPRASSDRANIRSPRPSSRRPPRRNIALGPGRRFRCPVRQRRSRHGRRPRRHRSARRNFLANAASTRPHCKARPSGCARDGATVVFVAVDSKAAGAHRHRRPDQADDRGGARRRCSADGIAIVMLTGDNCTTAQAVASEARHRRCRGRGSAGTQECA